MHWQNPKGVNQFFFDSLDTLCPAFPHSHRLFRATKNTARRKGATETRYAEFPGRGPHSNDFGPFRQHLRTANKSYIVSNITKMRLRPRASKPHLFPAPMARTPPSGKRYLRCLLFSKGAGAPCGEPIAARTQPLGALQAPRRAYAERTHPPPMRCPSPPRALQTGCGRACARR